jgi:hypothetical protein
VEVITARFEAVADSPGVAGMFDVVTIRAVRVCNEEWRHLRKPLRIGGALLFLHQADVEISGPSGVGPPERHRLTGKAQLSVFRRLA